MQIMKPGTETRSVASEFYVGPIEILSGLVQFPITLIKNLGFRSRLWDLGVVGPVD